MKNILIAVTTCFCLVFVSTNISAQSGKAAPATNASDVSTLQSPALPTKTMGAKQEEAKPVTVSPATNISENDVKTADIKPQPKQGIKPRNIDRPKTSTIRPDNKAAVPTMSAAPVLEKGN